ncbi:dolichol-phosphate mannosyltransferase [Branchiibius hedensis]|uniref:Dolichol-phosphate mannosyltransferase n=1 Tax=Branchiibius hedensis TaxID=672460 RepID=A0A2Y8ZRM5_9MICO|nr:glycosyltransferase family 2 protein [Branchiibius hedensis]PWJ25741.1 dolichol-phosphate mannosyltransferase [Branchiibius hedensis]SSA34554.1 dolichol-phosphate mannosyltransferase [Branchiibius hedensis]
MDPIFLTVVVPLYNEAAVLPLLVDRLRPVLDDLGRSYEVVAVDDGSTDTTAAVLSRFSRQWPQLRIVRLRANAGHQAAISAGLERSRGAWVVTIDADLQDPPETIREMIDAALRERVDVVYGVRTDRSSDTAFKRHTAAAFYRLVGGISGTNAPRDAGDFRLMSRATVDAVNTLPEANRVLRLVVPTLGFPSAEVGYRRAERAAGSSKYPLSKMLKLSIDSITGFSMAPLRLATWFGLGGFAIAVALLAYAIISKVVGNTTPGWTSTLLVVAGFGGLQLLCLGILGEYVGRVYLQQQQRPTYYVGYDSLLAPPPSDDADLAAPQDQQSHDRI